MTTAVAYELAACPACGELDGEEVADAAALKREVELLWEFHGERLREGVPVPRLLDRVAFTQGPALRVERCRACGLVWRNPRERAVRDAYAGEAIEESVLDALLAAQRDAARAQLARLDEVSGSPGRVLEVGSYVGGFLLAATEGGWRAEGVDVNERAVAFACSRGLRATVGDPETWAGTPGLDAVAIWNCFEQLPEPRAAAARAHALLAPGGVLAIRVPNGGFWAALRPRLGRRGGRLARLLLAHNNLLAFPYRHGFTPASLERLLAAQGFLVERTVGDALVPTADEWTRPWARWEERALKRALATLGRAHAEKAPWFEVYARRPA